MEFPDTEAIPELLDEIFAFTFLVDPSANVILVVTVALVSYTHLDVYKRQELK